MKPWLLLPLSLCGCSLNKFIPPPYAGNIEQHGRFFGLKAKIPYAGSSLIEVCLGWGSEVWSITPVSTNKLFSAPMSSTFTLGQSLNPFSVSITEDDVSGWEGPTPPPPRYRKLFTPKAKDNDHQSPKPQSSTPQGSNHSAAFSNAQATAIPYIPPAMIGISRSEYDDLIALRIRMQNEPPSRK